MNGLAPVIPLPHAAAEPVVAAEPWLSKKQLAGHYGVTTSTIDNWSRVGMPWHRRGSYRRFRLSECEAWHRARQ